MDASFAPASPAPIRVALALPSALWNQLLAHALSQPPAAKPAFPAAPLETVLGAAAAFEPCRCPPAVLLTAVPANRAGWERLAQWCRCAQAAQAETAPRPEAGARVLVLGDHGADHAARVLRLGAAGYLDAESSMATLGKAIRAVHAGELWAERRVAFCLLRGPAARSRSHALTPRERHVLQALAEGKRNKEIAALLAISETTVKSHLNRAYHKLHLSDRLQAALYVERHGLSG